MKLTEKPDSVNWPATAPQAWQMLHQKVGEISKQNKISGYMSLYKIEPQMIYLAGMMVDAKPENLPEGLHYMKFSGGKYDRFILTGSYNNLPEACGRVFHIVSEEKIPLRDDFFIENYVNDPKVTPEDQLITEILIPTT